MITSTSSTKYFTEIKHFSETTLAALDTAVNNFITGTLDADPYQYYTVTLGTSYKEGSNYIVCIAFTRFEIDSDWVSPAALP